MPVTLHVGGPSWDTVQSGSDPVSLLPQMMVTKPAQISELPWEVTLILRETLPSRHTFSEQAEAEPDHGRPRETAAVTAPSPAPRRARGGVRADSAAKEDTEVPRE